jgi:hypothetical protein
MTHKLVPLEPTEEMVLNAINTFGGVMGTPENLANPDYVNRMLDRQKKAVAGHYKAMLEASPTTDTVTLSKAEYDALVKDKERLDWLQSHSYDLRCEDVPTAGGDDADIDWIVVAHYQEKPQEREIGRAYKDDLRRAIDQAKDE